MQTVRILLLLFQSFSSLIVVARTSKTMLNNSAESGHSCLIPEYSEKFFSFSLLSMMLVMSLSIWP